MDPGRQQKNSIARKNAEMTQQHDPKQLKLPRVVNFLDTWSGNEEGLLKDDSTAIC